MSNSGGRVEIFLQFEGRLGKKIFDFLYTKAWPQVFVKFRQGRQKVDKISVSDRQTE